MGTSTIQPAEPLKDLKEASATARFLAAILLAAGGAYASCFGLLALLGTWRGTLLDPGQLALVIGILGAQSALGWSLKLRPLAAGAIFAILRSVPNAVLQAQAASPNDFPDVIYVLLLPPALSLLNGLFATRLFLALALPAGRGGEVQGP